jgi:hypothetical protein
MGAWWWRSQGGAAGACTRWGAGVGRACLPLCGARACRAAHASATKEIDELKARMAFLNDQIKALRAEVR